MHNFFVDAESDGLYGSFLSIAALVTDQDGQELDRFYGAVKVCREEIESPWVQEIVYPHLDAAEQIFNCEDALLEAFWQFWNKHRENANCIADVCIPVEARLFARCVEKDRKERELLGPYPLFDLSTLLTARNIPWNSDRRNLSGLNLTAHDAMNDLKMLAALWQRYIAAD